MIMSYMFKVCLEFSRTFFFWGGWEVERCFSKKSPRLLRRIPPVAGSWFPIFFSCSPLFGKNTSTLTLTDIFSAGLNLPTRQTYKLINIFPTVKSFKHKRVTRTLHGKPALIWSSPVTSMNRRRRTPRVEGLGRGFLLIFFFLWEEKMEGLKR